MIMAAKKSYQLRPGDRAWFGIVQQIEHQPGEDFTYVTYTASNSLNPEFTVTRPYPDEMTHEVESPLRNKGNKEGTIMHSTVFDGEGEGYLVHYNGSFDGDMIVTVPADAVTTGTFDLDTRGVRLPFGLMKEIVAAWKRNQLVSDLEDADADAILKEW
jgi:hypothetical protein